MTPSNISLGIFNTAAKHMKWLCQNVKVSLDLFRAVVKLQEEDLQEQQTLLESVKAARQQEEDLLHR